MSSAYFAAGGTYVGAMAGSYDFFVARVTPAGVLDPSFGTMGVVTTPIGDQDYAEEVLVDSLGRYLVLGWTLGAFGGPLQIAAARYWP